MPARILDLSPVVADGTVTTPGHPAARIGWWRTHQETTALYAEGTEFAFSHLDIIGGTGAYLDAPLHRFRDGGDVTTLDLARLTDVPGVLVDVTARAADATAGAGAGGGLAIGPDAFAGLDLTDRAVLVRTGWSARFGREDYIDGHPFLTADAAAALVAAGPAVVAIEGPNVDGTSTGERPVHTALLAAGIPIVEHLGSLAAVAGDFTFTALPLRFAGLATSPVRAVARLLG